MSLALGPGNDKAWGSGSHFANDAKAVVLGPQGITRDPFYGAGIGFTVPCHTAREDPEGCADIRFPIQGTRCDDLVVGPQKDNSRRGECKLGNRAKSQG
jgi:hypothetical protein